MVKEPSYCRQHSKPKPPFPTTGASVSSGRSPIVTLKNSVPDCTRNLHANEPLLAVGCKARLLISLNPPPPYQSLCAGDKRYQETRHPSSPQRVPPPCVVFHPSWSEYDPTASIIAEIEPPPPSYGMFLTPVRLCSPRSQGDSSVAVSCLTVLQLSL